MDDSLYRFANKIPFSTAMFNIFKKKYQPKPAFRLVKHSNGQIGIRLRGRNGKIILWSETYHNQADAISAIEAVAKRIKEHGTKWIWEDLESGLS